MLPKLSLSKPKTYPSSTTKFVSSKLLELNQNTRDIPVRTSHFQKNSYQTSNTIIEPKDENGSLYLGDFTAAMDKSQLKRKNIKTVLTVAIGMNIHYSALINHHVYPAFDVESFDLTKYFDQTYEAIENGLKNGSVLVHCAAGISRSSTIVIAYLMKKNKLTYQEAYSFVRKRRSVICPNSGFVRQLKNYEKKLKVCGK